MNFLWKFVIAVLLIASLVGIFTAKNTYVVTNDSPNITSTPAIKSESLVASIEAYGGDYDRISAPGVTSDVKMARIKFTATAKDVKISAITLGAVNGSVDDKISLVKLFDTGLVTNPTVPLMYDGNEVPMAGGLAVFSLAKNSEIIVPAWTSKTLTVVADIINFDSSASGKLGFMELSSVSCIIE